MPKYGVTKRYCKYCGELAKKYINSEGRFKCYCKTCGSDKCLQEQYRSMAVNSKKSYRTKEVRVNCQKCDQIFLKENYQQKWCKTCVPTKAARAILQRYNISDPEYQAMLAASNLCRICQERKPTVIDHCHKTNKVRGFICNYCNTALSLILIEDQDALKRALAYLKGT